MNKLNTRQGTLIEADYNYFLSKIPDGGADVVITDPAYWTLDKWRKMGTTTRLGGGLKGESDPDKFFETISEEDLWELMCECNRILPKNGHCWMMCDGQTLAYVLGFAAKGEYRGKKVFDYYKPYPVLKRAKTGGYRSGMGYHGRGCHEYVVLLEKGTNTLREKTTWNDVFDELWDGDAWSRQFTPDGEKYPTAKPLSLLEKLICLSSDPGQKVVDPFAGSGATAVAAINTGRKFLTCDKSERAFLTSRSAIEVAIVKNSGITGR